MIPARGHYEALYVVPTEGGGTHDRIRTVEAFADDGFPLVVGDDGRLVSAASLRGFSGISEAEHPPIVAAIPGGGWTVVWTDPESGKDIRQPAVGWAVDASGNARPLAVDGEGLRGSYTALPYHDGNTWLEPPEAS